MERRKLKKAQTISVALFGAKHRLPVALTVASIKAEELYAARVALEVKASEAQAGYELKRLEQVGLLESLPAETPAGRGRPPHRYRRSESVFWQLAQSLVDERPNRSTRVKQS